MTETKARFAPAEIDEVLAEFAVCDERDCEGCLKLTAIVEQAKRDAKVLEKFGAWAEERYAEIGRYFSTNRRDGYKKREHETYALVLERLNRLLAEVR